MFDSNANAFSEQFQFIFFLSFWNLWVRHEITPPHTYLPPKPKRLPIIKTISISLFVRRKADRLFLAHVELIFQLIESSFSFSFQKIDVFFDRFNCTTCGKNISLKYWFLSIDAFWKHGPKMMIGHYFRSGNLTSNKKDSWQKSIVNSTCMTFHLSIAWSIKSLCGLWVCLFIFQKTAFIWFWIDILFFPYSANNSFHFVMSILWIVMCISVVDDCGCGYGVCWKVRIQTEKKRVI